MSDDSSSDPWDDFPPGGVHASPEFRKLMQPIHKISDTNQPVPAYNKLRHYLVALRTASGWYTVADAEKDILALFAQPAPVAVGGEERMDGYKIADEMRDAVWTKPGFTFTGKNYAETLGEIKRMVAVCDEAQRIPPLSVPPAAETGTPKTDAYSKEANRMGDTEVVRSDFARTLERELAEAKSDLLFCESALETVIKQRDEESAQLSQAVSQRDEAKDQLSAANSALDEAKLKYVRREFIARMDAELIANERKGDWDAYRPKRFDTCAWMTEHTNKLWDALREHDRVKVSEFCADIANIAMKIDVTFGAKQEDIDAARLSQGKQEGGVTE